MIIVIVIFVILSLLTGCGVFSRDHANIKWSKSVTAGSTLYTAANIIDIGQTAYVYGSDFEEKNPLLSEGTYLPIMAISNILLYYLIKYIDPDLRPWVVWPAAVIKTGGVIRNSTQGIGFRIPVVFNY